MDQNNSEPASKISRFLTIALSIFLTIEIVYLGLFFGYIYVQAEKGTLSSQGITNLIGDLKQTSEDSSSEYYSHLILERSSTIYFPVDKTTALPSDYIPQVVIVGGVQGTPLVDYRVYGDTVNMFKDMLASGVNGQAISGYRSYANQIATFKQWVDYEISIGSSPEQANLNAGRYSAPPGHSEHQLGTALDILHVNCNIFGTGCMENLPVWDWLAHNAYKYGFVISYPYNKEAISGYVYEPWHYRWIGHDLALEFTMRTDGIILRDFLKEKGLY